MRPHSAADQAPRAPGSVPPAVDPGPGLWAQLTRGDCILAALVLLAFGLSVAWRAWWAPAGDLVRIEVGGRLLGEYSLAAPRLVRVEGPAGVSLVEIGPAGARIAAAPCAQQACRRQGRVARHGEAIVCVPNRLIVTVIGTADPAAVDAVSR
jgi:hypothetical protein